MESKRHKDWSVQSAISVLLLIVLGAIAGGVIAKQGIFDPSVFSAKETGSTEGGRASGHINSVSINSPEGFTGGAVEYYTSDTLFEKINGKADMYWEAGFSGLTAQRFVSQDSDGWFEAQIYEMESPAAAFAVYSQQRRDGVEPADFTKFAYSTVDGVFFARGAFYGELRGSDASAGLREAMIELGRELAEGIEADGSVEAALAMFGGQGVLRETGVLYPVNAFGFGGFKDVYAMRYRIGEQTAMAFLTWVDDGEALAGDYVTFMMANGARDITPEGLEIPARVYDFYNAVEVVFSKGQIMGGVHAARDMGTAVALAKLVYEGLAASAEASGEMDDYQY